MTKFAKSKWEKFERKCEMQGIETTDVSEQPGHAFTAELAGLLNYFIVVAKNVYSDNSCFTFCQDHLEMTMTLLVKHNWLR